MTIPRFIRRWLCWKRVPVRTRYGIARPVSGAKTVEWLWTHDDERERKLP